jgi:hypothetical protein
VHVESKYRFSLQAGVEGGAGFASTEYEASQLPTDPEESEFHAIFIMPVLD